MIGALLALGLVGFALAPSHATRIAHAGSPPGAPVITWVNSLFDHNGNPLGPTGALETAHGQNFTAGTQYIVYVQRGDTNADSTVCNAGGGVVIGDTATTPVVAKVDGTFDVTFTWPAAANVVGDWSVCAESAADHSVASRADSGPFYLIVASTPRISFTPTTAQPGDTIKVTGANWVPGGTLPVQVALYPCHDCDSPPTASQSATASGYSTGTFTTVLTIPLDAAAGTYYVGAIVTNPQGFLTAFPGVADPLQVTALPPTPTATLEPTSTTAPVATSAGGGTGADTGAGGTSLLVGALIGVGILLVASLGILAYFLLRRRGSGPPPPGPRSPAPLGTPAGPFQRHAGGFQGGPLSPPGGGVGGWVDNWDPGPAPPRYPDEPLPPGGDDYPTLPGTNSPPDHPWGR
jgi:hypothetical protein